MSSSLVAGRDILASVERDRTGTPHAGSGGSIDREREGGRYGGRDRERERERERVGPNLQPNIHRKKQSLWEPECIKLLL